MKDLTKRAFAVTSSIILAGGAAVAPIQMIVEQADALEAPQETLASEIQVGEQDSANRSVVGEFSYTQDATTENAALTNVFQKAVAGVCLTLPAHSANSCATGIEISVNGAAMLDPATFEKMIEEGSVEELLACACSSNVAGGGAIGNAKVSGTSLAALAEKAGVVLP